MGIFSLLPESLQTVELWIIRIFVRRQYLTISQNRPPLTEQQLFLAVVTFGPWIALLVYDIVLYLWRSATFELPQIGGRARGRQRPRAPSLKERPDGHRRRFSVAGVPVPIPSDLQESDGATHSSAATSTSTATSNHKRKITATMSRPIFEFADDDE